MSSDSSSSASASIATAKTVLSAAASIAATAVLVRTIASDLVPDSFYHHLSNLLSRFSTNLTIVVEESDGFSPNRMYRSAELYLGTVTSPTTRRLCVNKPKYDDESSSPSAPLQVTIDKGEEITDTYNNIKFTWILVSRETPRRGGHRHHFHGHYDAPVESRSFELTFHKKHRDLALKSYLPFVLDRAKAIREESKGLKLYTNNEDDMWTAVNLRHPATFGTVAMEAAMKTAVMEDLKRFLSRKEYYKRIGKAWKRGYLLYGPPGTGKSSLVAAMANFLKFNVYDLELTQVKSNAALRGLLLQTEDRSILVVEDIDCTVETQNRSSEKKEQRSRDSKDSPPEENEKVTLSGLLNFVDGLWSSCGDERIIVFTTNYKEKLDPALLRPGRMDMHIHMTYCTPNVFRILASNYHTVDAHPLFSEIEGLIREVDVSPAEVAEELMRSDDTEIALRGLIESLLRKKEEKVNAAKVSVERDILPANGFIAL